MVPIILALLVGLPASSSEQWLAKWNDCALSYAQVESAGIRSEASIAVNALAACSTEKARYAKALLNDHPRPASNAGSAIDQAIQKLAEDQRAIAVRTIAFVRRLRQG